MRTSPATPAAAKTFRYAFQGDLNALDPYSLNESFTLGALGNASMDHRFFHRMGASQLNRTICATAGGDALISVLGRKLGTDKRDLAL